MSVLTVQQVRKALHWDPSRDGDVVPLIAYVEDLWARMTGQRLGVVTDSVERHELWYPERLICLSVMPVTSHAVVAWDDGETEPDDFSDPLVRDEDYFLNNQDGTITVNRRKKHWKVQVSGGLSSSSFPVSVQHALVSQIIFQVQREGPDAAAYTDRAAESNRASFRPELYHPQFLAEVRRNTA
jgi:hypothetical protein